MIILPNTTNQSFNFSTISFFFLSNRVLQFGVSYRTIMNIYFFFYSKLSWVLYFFFSSIDLVRPLRSFHCYTFLKLLVTCLIHISRGVDILIIIHKYSEISVGVISPHLNMNRQFVSNHDHRNIFLQESRDHRLGTHHYFLGSMHEK